MPVGMPAPPPNYLLYSIPAKLAIDLTCRNTTIARASTKQHPLSGRSERMLIGVRVPASAPNKSQIQMGFRTPRFFVLLSESPNIARL